jgi:hypothetical protein
MLALIFVWIIATLDILRPLTAHLPISSNEDANLMNEMRIALHEARKAVEEYIGKKKSRKMDAEQLRKADWLDSEGDSFITAALGGYNIDLLF